MERICRECKGAKTRSSSLLNAARSGHFVCAKTLVKEGANVNTRTDNGESCLILAVRSDSYKCSKVFISAGSDVNVADSVGKHGFNFCNMEQQQ